MNRQSLFNKCCLCSPLFFYGIALFTLQFMCEVCTLVFDVWQHTVEFMATLSSVILVITGMAGANEIYHERSNGKSK